jgi:hypothetical protein
MGYWTESMTFEVPRSTEFTTVNGVSGFQNNPIWEYQGVSEEVDTVDDKDVASITMKVRRDSDGIVYRLFLPIIICSVCAGLTFWTSHGERLNQITVLLLAVSALYITILANIPLVGYLTKADVFVKYVRAMHV